MESAARIFAFAGGAVKKKRKRLRGAQMPRYKIADVVFETNHIYAYTPKLCKNYLYEGEEPSAFKAEMTEQDIAAERAKEGAEGFPDAYLESLALFRKLCEYTLKHANGMIFHSSAIAVEGKGYLLTAPSGTGKSTHARLLKELLGDKLTYINDDKPIIRLIGDKFYVYGTPWNGKHRLDTNTRAEIKAVCEIKRGKENFIEKISPKEMLAVAFNQTLRPEEAEDMDKYLNLLDRLLTSVDLYRLHCNVSEEAAKLSYGAMIKGADDEN